MATTTSGRATDFITFSRPGATGGGATVTDRDGKIKWAGHNLLTNSESFDASAWNKVGATVTANAVAAPNGTTTADEIAFTTTSATVARLTGNFPSVVAGASYTHGVWLRAKTGTFKLKVSRTDTTTWTTATVSSEITLTTDWQYVSISYTVGAGETLSDFVIGAESKTPYSLPATGSIYAWGAHVFRSDLGSMVLNPARGDAYYPTTPRNLLGSTEDFSAAAWNKSDVSLGNGFERISNGTFTTNMDGWTTVAGTTATSSGGAAVITVTGDYQGIRQNVSNLVVGRRYQLSADIVSISGGGNAYVSIDGLPSLIRTSPGRAVGYYTATATTHTILASSFAGTTGFSVDNISLQEIEEYTAPNGLQTADKIVESTANGLHTIDQYYTTTASPYTFSIYLKKAERSFVLVYNGQSNTGIVVNLDTGDRTSFAGISAPVASSATSVGDGWYRCSITVNATAASNFFRIYLMPSASVISYTGDGTSGIYLWGAQLSDSASLDAYSPVYGAAVTSAAYYAPRLDYLGSSLAALGLLVEEQRTNVLLHSNDFSQAAWADAAPSSVVTVAANSTASPDGSTNAAKLTASTGGTNAMARQARTLVASTVYSGSIYIKGDTSTQSRMLLRDTTSGVNFADATINWSAGVPTIAGGATGTWSAVPVGGNWYRIVGTGTTGASPTPSVTFSLFPDTAAGTNAIFAYGAQLEAGSFATSYIPNGSAVAGATRTADVASVSTQAFPYNQNTGSLVFSFGALNFSGSLAGASPYDTAIGVVTDGARQGRQFSAFNNTGWRIRTKTGTPNEGTAISGSGSLAPLNGPAVAHKLGIAISASEFAGVVNGGTVTIDAITSAPTGTANLLYINQLINGHVRQITYIPRRLSNSELQSRTA